MALKIGVLGSGSFATALCKILSDNHHHINWWVRNQATIDHIQSRHHNPHYLSSVYFDTKLFSLSTSAEEVINNSDLIIIVVPAAYLLDSLSTLPENIFEEKKIVSAVKGIIPEKNLFLNQYLEEKFAIDIKNYVTLMGPCHAEEVANEKLSYLTFSCEVAALAKEVSGYFANDYIRVVSNDDVSGVQYAAVLKNIYALGAGIAHGLEYGDNFQSVYIANCGEEMACFLKKINNSGELNCSSDIPVKYASSAYLGDLLVTCYSLYSRNRTFGNMLGKGYSVVAAKLELNMVAEGYNASKCIHFLNQEIKSEIPIAETIYRILWENISATEGFKMIEQKLV